MNHTERKKKIEHHQVKRFLNRIGILESINEIYQPESDPPDAYIVYNGQRIGIEITQLIHPQKIEVERYRDQVVEDARLLFKEQYSEEIDVFLNFNAEGASRQQMAQKIFELVESIYLKHKGTTFDIRVSDELQKRIPNFISYLQVTNILGSGLWQKVGAFWVPPIDISFLTKVIQRKEKALAQYSKSYDQVWLLLITDLGYESSAHDFKLPPNVPIDSSFDQIHIYGFRANEHLRIL